MPTYKTWLNDNFTDYTFNKKLGNDTVRPGAIVAVDSLAEVYRVTNNIDCPWTENPEVLKVLTSSPRSLSVGDLVAEDATGKLYVVEDFGFREVTAEEHATLNFDV